VLFRAAAQASVKAYQRYDLEFGAPHFARQKLFFDFFAVHHNYPGINYYGPGPHSSKSSRSDFRLEDTAIDGTFGVQPFRCFKLGLSSGYLFVNVGPGTDSRFVSSEKIFSPTEAPGIDRQTDFLRLGAFAQFDYRDNPGGPRSGGNYLVAFDYYSDRILNLYTFRRLDVDLQQYIPLFNRRRVIALRGKTTVSYTSTGQRVPFYLQPVLGGSNDLRGFRAFRFYDDNLILLNAEYRWEVFSGLDMALFADGGKVFPKYAPWNFRHLEGSGGFGFRFNVRNNVFLRIDAGFSREGPQVWFKFDNVFGGERLRSSRFQ
jgi:outer membrane protein assembly factor BamA